MRRKLKSDGQFSNKPITLSQQAVNNQRSWRMHTIAVPLSAKVARLAFLIWPTFHGLVQLLHRFRVDHVART